MSAKSPRLGRSARLSLLFPYGLFGTCVGILCVLSAFVMCWRIEGEETKAGAVHRWALDRCKTVRGPKESDNGKLVLHTGSLGTTPSFLKDTKVGITVESALFLRRNVSMFQYIDRESFAYTDSQGDVQMVISKQGYVTDWSDVSITTGDEAAENPQEWLLRSYETAPREVRVGSFRLGPSVVATLGATIAQRLAMSPSDVEEMPAHLVWYVKRDADGKAEPFGFGLKLHDDGYLYTGDPESPKVGDYRVGYEYGPIGDAVASALGKEDYSKGEIAAYDLRNHKALKRLVTFDAPGDDRVFSLASAAAQKMLDRVTTDTLTPQDLSLAALGKRSAEDLLEMWRPYHRARVMAWLKRFAAWLLCTVGTVLAFGTPLMDFLGRTCREESKNRNWEGIAWATCALQSLSFMLFLAAVAWVRISAALASLLCASAIIASVVTIQVIGTSL